MAFKQLQKLTNRPVVRDRIRNRYNGLEPKCACRIAFHNTPTIRAVSFVVLNIVMTCRVRLPYINSDSFDWVSLHVFHSTNNYAWLAFGVGRQSFAIGYCFCVVGVERTQHRAFSTRGRFRVIDRIYEKRKSQNIRKEDELLLNVSAVHASPAGIDLHAEPQY